MKNYPIFEVSSDFSLDDGFESDELEDVDVYTSAFAVLYDLDDFDCALDDMKLELDTLDNLLDVYEVYSKK